MIYHRYSYEVARLSARTLREVSSRHGDQSSDWHRDYEASAVIYVGNIPSELTEGDVVCVFSQYGEILHINMPRPRPQNRSTGSDSRQKSDSSSSSSSKHNGASAPAESRTKFCFLKYEDQRSTVLAVDNLNGTKLLGRVLRVDHVKDYRRNSTTEDMLDESSRGNAAPENFQHAQKPTAADDCCSADEEDPMRAYILDRQQRRQQKRLKREQEGSSRRKQRKPDPGNRADGREISRSQRDYKHRDAKAP